MEPKVSHTFGETIIFKWIFNKSKKRKERKRRGGKDKIVPSFSSFPSFPSTEYLYRFTRFQERYLKLNYTGGLKDDDKSRWALN
jgi:hypothetical protein